MNKSRFFKPAEFQACTPSCSIHDVSQLLLDALDRMREIYGRPIYLTSVFRSVFYEKSKKRSGCSLHTYGLAADIRCVNGTERYQLINAALAAGFSGIGIYETFLHLDIRESGFIIFYGK